MHYIVKLNPRYIEFELVGRLIPIPLRDEVWKTIRQLKPSDQDLAKKHVARNCDRVDVKKIYLLKAVKDEALNVKLEVQPLVFYYYLAGDLQMQLALYHIVKCI